MQEITVGKKYRHYKGNVYEIIALAKHSETGEDMVVYQNVEKGDIWVRPKSMWNELVNLTPPPTPLPFTTGGIDKRETTKLIYSQGAGEQGITPHPQSSFTPTSKGQGEGTPSQSSFTPVARRFTLI